MNAGNNFAPAYQQPTNPPAGPLTGTYTASSNNAASRGGADRAATGRIPNRSDRSDRRVSAGRFLTARLPAQDTAQRQAPDMARLPSAGYGTTPTAGYGTTPNAGYGTPSGGSGAGMPTSPYGGSSSALPSASGYPRGTAASGTIPMNPTSSPAGPVTGNYDAGWSSPPGNPVRQPSPPLVATGTLRPTIAMAAAAAQTVTALRPARAGRRAGRRARCPLRQPPAFDSRPALWQCYAGSNGRSAIRQPPTGIDA